MPELPLLVFDVNETLMDLDALKPHFERIFGDAGRLREWFAQVILYSEALTLAGHYAPFGELGGAVLKMLGAIHRVVIGDQELRAVKQAVAEMPPHADTVAALGRLRKAGFRLFTLTNNPIATCMGQLERGGMLEMFERQFSIDEQDPARPGVVPVYKPAPEAYRAVERALGVSPERLCLIACHTWDTLGAAAAGWETALVLRAGNAALPLGPQPTIIAESLTDVATTLIARYAGAA